AYAHLDRPKAGMRTEIPPDERVVIPRLRAFAARDERLEVFEAVEQRRDAAARHRVEHLRPRRREPRVATVPERRVRRCGQQLREPRAETVRDRDRLVGRLEADMDVQAEDQLALDRPLESLDELGVPP